MRLCVSLCLQPSSLAIHATHTHRVSLQEGVWLHAGERVRRRWPLRGRPSAVRQVSDGRRSHCVTHTHTLLPGRVRTVEVWRKVRTVCARASGVWPCMHAQACRGLRVLRRTLPGTPALTFSCFRAPPCTASCHAGTRGLAGRGVYTHAPPGEIRTVQMCRISQGGMSEHAPPCKIRTDQVCLASHEGCLCCVCVCVCLCLAAAASGPAT